jgi:hypothetical protein
LWSRNRGREIKGTMSFEEGERLLKAVRDGLFDAVVSEEDLERVAEIGGFRAQRWHPDLVAAVRERYALRDRVTAGSATLYVYVRR